MKATPRRSVCNDAVFLWLACIVALCAGYYIAFYLLGTAIDTEHNLTGRLSDTALANARILARRPELEREERIVGNRLRQLDLYADKSTTVARFIHAVARIGATRGVRLVQVDERATPAAAPATVPAPENSEFESIPLDVTLCGSYRELLATIRDLARAPVTMQIEIAAIERNVASAGDKNAALTARLHIVLKRLTDPSPASTAVIHASAEETTTHARPF